MFYGYENSPQLPSMNVYDTSLMKAYIEGAREQYNQAREDQANFMKAYSDFVSPIAADNKYYYDKTVGGASDMIRQMYASGIDPLKSPQARAAMTRFIASRPYGELALIKANAKNYELYLQAVAQMKANGTYSQALEDLELKEAGIDPTNWSTVDGNGNIREWNRLSPTKYQDLNQLTSHYFDALQPSDLGLVKGKKFTHWYGVSDEAIAKEVPSVISGLKQTANGRLFIQQAYDMAVASLPNGTKEQIQEQAAKNIINLVKQANYEKLMKRQIVDEEGKQLNQQAFEAAQNQQKREALEYIAGLRGGGRRTNNGKLNNPTLRPFETAIQAKLTELVGGVKAVNRKTPQKDANGKIVRDKDGKIVYRPTVLTPLQLTLSKAIRDAGWGKLTGKIPIITSSIRRVKKTDEKGNTTTTSSRYIDTNRVTSLLNKLSGTEHSGGFAVRMGRSAVGGNGARVNLDDADLNNLYSPAQLLSLTGYAHSEYKKLASQQNQSDRNDIKAALTAEHNGTRIARAGGTPWSPYVNGAETSGMTMTYTGKFELIPMRNGKIHAFKLVEIPVNGGTKKMYLDAGMVYNDDNTGGNSFTRDEYKSLPGIEGDAREATVYKSDKPASVFDEIYGEGGDYYQDGYTDEELQEAIYNALYGNQQ